MSLGGTMFIIDGIKYDYCFVESIKSMKEFCDEVVVVDAGSNDGTIEVLQTLEDKKTKIIYLDREEWDSMSGFAKLNHFSNKAIAELTTEWNYYQQSDEITHEKSYSSIMEAMHSGKADGYYISRINLWGSPFTKLNVHGARNPCSTIILRLAKSKYMTGGDAESIYCDDVNADYVDKIRMYHVGFVRKKEIMKSKIINMQCEVFGMADYDKKLDHAEVFDHRLWFNPEDLEPIKEPLPRIISDWAINRI